MTCLEEGVSILCAWHAEPFQSKSYFLSPGEFNDFIDNCLPLFFFFFFGFSYCYSDVRTPLPTFHFVLSFHSRFSISVTLLLQLYLPILLLFFSSIIIPFKDFQELDFLFFLFLDRVFTWSPSEECGSTVMAHCSL